MTPGANLYSSVNDVIQNVRDSFLDEGIDEAKLAANKTIDQGPGSLDGRTTENSSRQWCST